MSVDKDIVWCEPGYEAATAFDARDRPEFEHELVMPRHLVGDRIIIRDSGEVGRIIRIVQGTYPRRYIVKLWSDNLTCIELINDLMEAA